MIVKLKVVVLMSFGTQVNSTKCVPRIVVHVVGIVVVTHYRSNVIHVKDTFSGNMGKRCSL